MERNQSQMKPTGKSSHNPANNSIVKDSAAQAWAGHERPTTPALRVRQSEAIFSAPVHQNNWQRTRD